MLALWASHDELFNQYKKLRLRLNFAKQNRHWPIWHWGTVFACNNWTQCLHCKQTNHQSYSLGRNRHSKGVVIIVMTNFTEFSIFVLFSDSIIVLWYLLRVTCFNLLRFFYIFFRRKQYPFWYPKRLFVLNISQTYT